MSFQQVCFEKNGFEDFLNVLDKYLGSAGQALIFQMSREYGHSIIKKFSQLSGASEQEDIQEQIESHLKNVNRMGWGEIKYTKMELEAGEFDIELWNNMFRSNCVGKYPAVCYYIRGVMAGTMEEITGHQLKVDTADCIEDSDHCIFKFRQE